MQKLNIEDLKEIIDTLEKLITLVESASSGEFEEESQYLLLDEQELLLKLKQIHETENTPRKRQGINNRVE